MGFMLLGMACRVVNDNTLSATNAYSSAMFYVVSHVLTTLGTFGMVILLSRQGFEAEELRDFAGLNQAQPLVCAGDDLLHVLLAGVPPMVGFYAKLAVLQALVATGVAGYLQLAVFAVVISLIGAFYYLRVVKVMYFDEPTDTTAIAAPADVRVVMSLNGAAVLVFGLLPGGLMALCAHRRSMRALASRSAGGPNTAIVAAADRGRAGREPALSDGAPALSALAVRPRPRVGVCWSSC